MLIVSGPLAQSIGDVIGLGDQARARSGTSSSGRSSLLVVMLIVALLYYATPNVKQPKFRWISVGAGVAILIWVAGLGRLRLLRRQLRSYNKTYGSLAGVIVGLLFLWITNLALLFGAEIDSELERGRQLQAGIAPRRSSSSRRATPATSRRLRKKEDEGRRRGPPDPPAARRAPPSDTTTPTTTRGEDIMKKLSLLVAVARRLRARRPAGRERYEQIKSIVNKVKDDPRVQEEAHQAADTAKEQAPVVKDKVTSAAGAPRPPRRCSAVRLVGTTTSCSTSSTPTAPRARTTRTRRATCPERRSADAAGRARRTALASVSDATWSMTARRRPASSAAAAPVVGERAGRGRRGRAPSSASTSSASSSRWRAISATRSSACIT